MEAFGLLFLVKPFSKLKVLPVETIKIQCYETDKDSFGNCGLFGNNIHNTGTNKNSGKDLSKTWNHGNNGIQSKGYSSQKNKLLLRRWCLV